MKTLNLNSKALTAGVVLLMTCGQSFAETPVETDEPMVLQKIMRDMGKNMQLIADGISREDWKLVEQNALLVADHPQPPLSEKVRIMAFAGADISQFKKHDGKTHDAARTLSEAAVREDGYAVIADFATLQNSCLMCHQHFRESFKEHFYGER